MGEGLSSTDILRTKERGVFRCGRPNFLVQKTWDIFEIYGVSARTREEGVEPVRIFCGQGGRGQFFAIFCGRLLWMTPIKKFID